jgi:hypothetical protein
LLSSRRNLGYIFYVWIILDKQNPELQLCHFYNFQENAETSKNMKLLHNQFMVAQVMGSAGFGTGGRGQGSAPLGLVNKNALSKLSTIQNVYFAQVVEEQARSVFDFPAASWDDLLMINRLLSPPGEGDLSLEEMRRGAQIVSIC